MANPTFITPEQFDVSKLRPSEIPTKDNNGNINVWLNYEYPNGTVDQLSVFTDWVYLNWGLNCYKGNWGSDISFWKMDENPKLAALFKVFSEIDNFMVDLFHKNWNSWFGVQKTREIVQEKYRPLIEEKQPGKFAPVGKVRAKTINGNTQFGFKVFDHEKNEVEISPSMPDALGKRNTKCRILINLSYGWYKSQLGFGISARAKQYHLSKPYFNPVVQEPIQFEQPAMDISSTTQFPPIEFAA